MIFKLKIFSAGIVSTGLRCGTCGLWLVIPISIPKILRFALKKVGKGETIEGELPGRYVCESCEKPAIDETPKSKPKRRKRSTPPARS